MPDTTRPTATIPVGPPPGDGGTGDRQEWSGGWAVMIEGAGPTVRAVGRTGGP